METTIVACGYIGLMEKKMETTVMIGGAGVLQTFLRRFETLLRGSRVSGTYKQPV